MNTEWLGNVRDRAARQEIMQGQERSDDLNMPTVLVSKTALVCVPYLVSAQNLTILLNQ